MVFGKESSSFSECGYYGVSQMLYDLGRSNVFSELAASGFLYQASDFCEVTRFVRDAPLHIPFIIFLLKLQLSLSVGKLP